MGQGNLISPFPSLIYSTFQSFPDLQPLYDAARSYLEIPQRIDLLNTRVEVSIPHPLRVLIYRDSLMLQVLQDMLQLLKESVSTKHSERLEQIIIALIAVEIGEFLHCSSQSNSF